MKTIIGIGAPLSGLAAALGREMVQAIGLAVREFNQAGGPGGSEIETIVCDDGSDVRTARAISDYLVHRRGKRRAVVVRTDSAYGNSMAGAFECAFAQSGGTVAGSFVVRQGETDLRELVGRLPGDFDVLFYGGTFEGAPLLRALRAGGFSQLMAAGDGCWDTINFLRPAGEALDQGEGVVVLSASAGAGEGIGQRSGYRLGCQWG